MTRQKVLELIEALAISPRKALGQNFLVSERVIHRILEEVSGLNSNYLLEIGPGLGALTEGLNSLGKPLLLIELDRRMAEYWRFKKVNIVEDDALKIDWKSLKLPKQSLLVSNLPYQISSRLVIDRSLEPANVSLMVLMFQKEVAEKILCKPRNENFGLLSVIAQTFWNIQFVLEAAPGEFYPSPKVASRVLSFSLKDDEISNTLRQGDFFEMVKSAFAYRRKFLVKNLGNFLRKYNRSPQELIEILKDLKHNEKVRAEELSSGDFVEVYQKLKGI